ncbi:PulJ/GspJ family protein [Paenibacillus sp.]|uniref:PulJ/GspJ family protein n=1 Tax=Paenibacillus sp. TaxID=58172 RepID=UPI002D565720|nr:prepilin-type N-terminal cleavage/methylation domain-containing protein [Paenibacillus sp.]HZG88499.1 prepilin-type N-terminal cleavage/methylation domain-containing protein [Paenibacillus sp.]
MMRPLRNERGLTLIELLASLVIGAIVLAAATTVLGSVSHWFATSGQRAADRADVDRTMQALAAELGSASRAVYFDALGEIRYVTGDGVSVVYKAAVFDETTGTVTVYRFGDASRFTDGTVSLTSRPGMYAAPMPLGGNLDSIVFEIQGVDSGTAASNGELIEIEAAFQIAQVTNAGVTRTSLQPERRIVKLLDENGAN